ncbi:hypothetical protein GOP47_0019533 [Adiantum capillus-veneris]|uniref:Uncharacterized protein n=1 Tax=Adiantum capillus-veneris TaxID=13818 RepID=A0A9D4Z755_ADICA|nr:hypothetical protein GOP47_0019533 [Adiantum capillus-veneris]
MERYGMFESKQRLQRSSETGLRSRFPRRKKFIMPRNTNPNWQLHTNVLSVVTTASQQEAIRKPGTLRVNFVELDLLSMPKNGNMP